LTSKIIGWIENNFFRNTRAYFSLIFRKIMKTVENVIANIVAQIDVPD